MTERTSKLEPCSCGAYKLSTAYCWHCGLAGSDIRAGRLTKHQLEQATREFEQAQKPSIYRAYSRA